MALSAWYRTAQDVALSDCSTSAGELLGPRPPRETVPPATPTGGDPCTETAKLDLSGDAGRLREHCTRRRIRGEESSEGGCQETRKRVSSQNNFCELSMRTFRK